MTDRGMDKNMKTVNVNRLFGYYLSPSRRCLFVCFSSQSGIFHSYGDFTISGEGLQTLIYARQLWPLSSENSLAFHTYCDTGHPSIVIVLKDPWHSHLLPSVWQWICHYLFFRLRSVAAGIRTPNLPLVRQIPLRTKAVYLIVKQVKNIIMLLTESLSSC